MIECHVVTPIFAVAAFEAGAWNVMPATACVVDAVFADAVRGGTSGVLHAKVGRAIAARSVIIRFMPRPFSSERADLKFHRERTDRDRFLLSTQNGRSLTDSSLGLRKVKVGSGGSDSRT
jgi:hypothetical protein